jgi:hypothetical protein
VVPTLVLQDQVDEIPDTGVGGAGCLLVRREDLPFLGPVPDHQIDQVPGVDTRPRHAEAP